MKKSIKILLIAVSIAIFLAVALLFGKAIYDRQLSGVSITETATEVTPQPTATPEPKENLLVIDASNMYTEDAINEIVREIGEEYGTSNTYLRLDYNDIDSIQEALADSTNAIVIAPEDVLNKINTEFAQFDSSKYEYTNMTTNNPNQDYIPFAFSMYGYLIRYDIAQSMELQIPQDYGDIMEICQSYQSRRRHT